MKTMNENLVLKNNNGIEVHFDRTGATITKLLVDGICVGTKGITVGRCANRIGGASFELNGETYLLEKNDGVNTLHGGFVGFAGRCWDVLENRSSGSITFALHSPDGEEGFPGNLDMTVTFTLDDEGALTIDYAARSDKDTIFNPTNHTYFNLNGDGPACAQTAQKIEDATQPDVKDTHSQTGHALWMNVEEYTPADEALIPTGEIASVEGTIYDYRCERGFEGGCDTNMVIAHANNALEKVRLDENSRATLASGADAKTLTKAARLTGLASGITCEVFTDMPGMQLYNTETEICLETQFFPDAIHHANFAQPVLRAGEEFRSTTIYKFNREGTIDERNRF